MKKIILAIVFMAIAMASSSIASIYRMDKNLAEAEDAVQADGMSFSCGVSECTQTEVHQHGLCEIDGCTQIGEHSHGGNSGKHHQSGHEGGHH